jgi:uncharacterized protein YraI
VRTYKKLMCAAVILIALTGIARADCVVADPSNTPLNVRNGPSSSAAILGALNNGTTVVIKDRRGDWASIVPQGDGKSGWVWREYLDCSRDTVARRRNTKFDKDHVCRAGF